MILLLNYQDNTNISAVTLIYKNLEIVKNRVENRFFKIIQKLHRIELRIVCNTHVTDHCDRQKSTVYNDHKLKYEHF